MESIPLDKTTKFESPKEGINYLLKLGATEIKIDDSKYYLLDNLLFEVNYEYESLYVRGLPDGLEYKLRKSPLSNCYYGWNIFNLEGLVYLHCLVNYGEDSIEENYNRVLSDLRFVILNSAYYDSKRLHTQKASNNIVIPIDRNKEEEFIFYKNLFDNLTMPNYLFEEEENFNNFLDHAIFGTSGVYRKSDKSTNEDCSKFRYNCNNIRGYFEASPGFMETTLSIYCYSDDSKHDQIYHYVTKQGEFLRYFKGPDPIGCIDLDLTNNMFEDTQDDKNIKRFATQEDYEFFTDLLKHFSLTTVNNLGLKGIDKYHESSSKRSL